MTDSPHSLAKKGERYTVQQVIDVLHATRGMITVAATKLKCDPKTVRRYIRLYPTVAQALRDERESVTDLAELALVKAIQSGEGWAICFYLKTMGRERGYVERQEVEHSGKDGGPIPVVFFNYDAAITALAAGPAGDPAAPGDDESIIDGQALG